MEIVNTILSVILLGIILYQLKYDTKLYKEVEVLKNRLSALEPKPVVKRKPGRPKKVQ